ncbi:MAG: pyridoxal-phosphate dependent enzyme, partial [Nitriliruptoraceae bacterium]
MNVQPERATVTREAIAAAHDRIADYLPPSPVLDVESDAFGLVGAPLTLKLDLLQPTGSFKVRGALSLLTAAEVPEVGVVAASGGNFGLAVAWAANRLGKPASIFVPSTSPAAKLDALRAAGAQLTVVDGVYAHALAEADAWCEATGALRAHAYDDADVVAGQGTAAVELSMQAEVDTVVVA